MTSVEISRQPRRRTVEVSYFYRTRLIEIVRVEPGGAVTVLS